VALGRMPAVSLACTTAGTSAALTVAGQWRIFTAFPNILVSLSDLGTQAAENPAQKGQNQGGNREDSHFRPAVPEPSGATLVRVAQSSVPATIPLFLSCLSHALQDLAPASDSPDGTQSMVLFTEHGLRQKRGRLAGKTTGPAKVQL